jgi:glycosyltransferase involved in cell wall biosynthesis
MFQSEHRFLSSALKDIVVLKMMEYNGITNTMVIIATLNEEAGLGPTLTDLKSSLENPHCLVVDGRSTDRTVEVAQELGAQTLVQKGLGKGDAIATAIGHINWQKVDYVVLIDADYTYPAKYISSMIRILEENPEIGMVCGNRFTNGLKFDAMPNVFNIGNKILSFTHSLLNGVDMDDPLTGLRVIRKEIMQNWQPKSKGFDIEVELNHLVESRGYRIVEVPIDYRARLGEKKLAPKHGFTIFKRILAESI